MCDKENCNCGSNPCCGDCEPWNCVEQAVNDVWSTKEGQIEELVERGETSAENSEASAQASAGSAAESKEFRDEAEIAATTAVAAEGVVLGVANTLQDTADKLQQIADELGTAIAGISVVTWYYTAVSDNQTVIPVPTDKNQVDVQSIYIEGVRQEPNRGFTYDALNKEIILTEGIPLGMEISIIIGTYSDNPNDFANTLASNNGASLIGTLGGETVQEELNQFGDPVYGDSKIAVRQPFTESLSRTQHDFNAQFVTLLDAKAKGDGVVNDTAAFALYETWFTGRDVDLLGKTYFVDSIPTGNRYYNGEWILPAGPSRNRYQGAQLTGAGRIGFGDGALESLPMNYSTESTGAVIALGYKAMNKMQECKKSIAIGANAMENSLISRDNVAMGDSALKNIQSVTADYSQEHREGTRVVGIGGNAGYFVSSGYSMVLIGRNAGQCIVSGNGATAVGPNACAGYAPIGLSGEIENWAPMTVEVNYSAAIGTNALNAGISGFCAALGGDALKNNKKSNGNVGVGPQALKDIDIDTWFNGGKYTELDLPGTYGQAGSVITLTVPGHTMSVGDIAIFRLLDGDAQTFQNDKIPGSVVSVISSDKFTLVSPKALSTTGSAHVYGKASIAQQPLNENNTAVGALSAFQLKTGGGNSSVGYRSLNDATTGDGNAAVGFRALSGLTNPTRCSALGSDALRFMVDGSVSSGSGENRTGLGYNTRVSGNNQVQIGNASTTTYVFGTVQNRSDERDKDDVRDTVLGIDFILGLRPVDGRWDLRDDYFEEYQVQTGVDNEANPVFETRLRPIPKDGSKKRERFHHWFIAQEVKELCDKLGVEFGGYQDHKVNGGCDVLSLGYDEFIPPTVRAVQQCWERMDAMEARLAKLEAQ